MVAELKLLLSLLPLSTAVIHKPVSDLKKVSEAIRSCYLSQTQVSLARKHDFFTLRWVRVINVVTEPLPQDIRRVPWQLLALLLVFGIVTDSRRQLLFFQITVRT